MKNNKIIIGMIALLSFGYGCKKSYLETKPSDAITDETLFNTTESAYTVLNGLHRQMSSNAPALNGTAANDWGAKTYDLTSDVMGNDVVCNGSEYDWFDFLYKYTSLKLTISRDVTSGWAFYYKIINGANILLANVDNAIGPDEEKADIKGQAYAYRAWAYYNLSVYYCRTYNRGRNNPGLPIYTTPTTGATEGAKRSTVGEVYDLIDQDVLNAIENLKIAPNSSNKSYISLATAYGIAARIALVKEDWVTAKEMSTNAIASAGGEGRLMDEATYKAGFNTALNSEFMWASSLATDQTQSFTNRSFFSFVDATPTSGYASVAYRRITKQLQDLIKAGDVRKLTFNASRQQTKFRVGDPSKWEWDNLYMRLAEMYLIKAEAEAEMGQSEDAIETLETLIKKRNPDYEFSTATGPNATAYASAITAAMTGGTGWSSWDNVQKLKEEIYLQRRIELYLEGFSLHDILRLNKGLRRPTGAGNHNAATANSILTIAPENADQLMFKIPQSELDPNPNMSDADQNP